MAKGLKKAAFSQAWHHKYKDTEVKKPVAHWACI